MEARIPIRYAIGSGGQASPTRRPESGWPDLAWRILLWRRQWKLCNYIYQL